MCAGDGDNAKILRDAGIDVICYDLKGYRLREPRSGLDAPEGESSDKITVCYGLCGTVEAQHPDRTLYLAQAYEAKRSVEAYAAAGGKRVILGGKVKSGSYATAFGVESLSDTSQIQEILAPACSHSDGKHFYSISTRPDYAWMRDNEWTLHSTHFGCKSDFNTDINVYQVWSR